MMAAAGRLPSGPWERAQGSEHVKIFVSCNSWKWNEPASICHTDGASGLTQLGWGQGEDARILPISVGRGDPLPNVRLN